MFKEFSKMEQRYDAVPMVIKDGYTVSEVTLRIGLGFLETSELGNLTPPWLDLTESTPPRPRPACGRRARHGVALR